jgi:hypothetical protein
MTYDAEGREARRRELGRKTRAQLVAIHRQGAGCLMSRAELMRWSHEDLEIAILDGEFGPLPTVLLDIPEITQHPLNER